MGSFSPYLGSQGVLPLPLAGCIGANTTAEGQEEPLPALPLMSRSQNNSHLPWLALLHRPEDMV